MKNINFELPYVTYEVEVYFEEIDNHPDPNVRRNVINAMGWEKYRIWYAMHQNGIKKPYRIRNRVHIGGLCKSPEFIGQLIGVGIVVVPALLIGLGTISLLGYGIFKIVTWLL